MEQDVLNALNTRTAYFPGSYDREGRIILIVNIINDLHQTVNRETLEITLNYLKLSLSADALQKGLTVIVDAQRSVTRITRAHARIIYGHFRHVNVNLYLVKAEGFWEKHMETCTKSHTKGEPIVLSKARLAKYIDVKDLPEELGGQLQFNYDLWLKQRKSIDEFEKSYEANVRSMENLNILLLGNKISLHPMEADKGLKKCAQMHATVQSGIEDAIETSNRILSNLNKAYAQPSPFHSQQSTETERRPAGSNCEQLTAINHSITGINSSSSSPLPLPSPSLSTKPNLPPDLQCARTRIELRLHEIEKKQTEIRTAWLELLQSIREARELTALAEGVSTVTNWLLNTAEAALNRQQSLIGCDVRACEMLRTAHDAFELECSDTYGHYAELLYKIGVFAGCRETAAYRDLESQRDFMKFVCHSFATRLERRRNVLITSLRFFRLVTEYFERTTSVFESLVMGQKMNDFGGAAETLVKLKESQQDLGNTERELIKEGEKLSDMLAMPVKDALGRDLKFDYSDDIANIREILDTTIARRNIFSDSVELQKLTLEQVTHIHAYEMDARMAIQWMDDLYVAMVKCHSHVGCNIHEIQVQKDELQSFQETGKSIYNYGCQLLEASQLLRTSSKLDPWLPQKATKQLQRTWNSLQAVSQEQMTRLRVSAVFHRSVEEYSRQLHDLKTAVRSLITGRQAASSSSGVSSESDEGTRNANSPPSTSTSSPSSSSSSSSTFAKAPLQQQQQQQHHQPSAIESIGKCDQRNHLRKHLELREKLLVEVGRMVRLGRLLKTRLKEPFVLDPYTGKR